MCILEIMRGLPNFCWYVVAFVIMWLNNFTSRWPPPDDGELVVFQEDFVSKEAYLKFLES